MYNTDIPTRAELPSAKKLWRSTLIAVVSAIAILVTVVLPAEYNIDPTGVGRFIGLTEMGEIKAQLAEEAEQDRKLSAGTLEKQSLRQQQGLLGRLFSGLIISSAQAQEAPAVRSDEMVVTLKPGAATEIKLVMRKDAAVVFEWIVEGGVVNFDMHADSAKGEAISYEKGRAVPAGKGTMTASFDGNHGWFWRNRGTGDVTLTLKTQGAYTDIKKMM